MKKNILLRMNKHREKIRVRKKRKLLIANRSKKHYRCRSGPHPKKFHDSILRAGSLEAVIALFMAMRARMRQKKI
jgi:hypothetical protein